MLFLTWKKKIGKPFFQGYHYFLFRKGLVPRKFSQQAGG